MDGEHDTVSNDEDGSPVSHASQVLSSREPSQSSSRNSSPGGSESCVYDEQMSASPSISEANDKHLNSRVKESEVLYDTTHKEIYITKVAKDTTKRTRQKKKGDRVYNSYHSCLFCEQLFQHIPVHMKTHIDQPQIKAMFAKEKHPNFDSIRVLGDDAHNRRVMREGRGELLLHRRPTKSFSVDDYGSCPKCRIWQSLAGLKKHYKKCGSQSPKLSTKELLVQSAVLSDRAPPTGSNMLHSEVFLIVTRDEVTRVAQNDKLIVALGESWLQRNLHNVEKWKYYASQHMRLAARFLICMREQKKQKEQAITKRYHWQWQELGHMGLSSSGAVWLYSSSSSAV